MIRFDNMDASENAFFARQLEHIRPGLLEIQYGKLIAAQLIPFNTRVPAGAEVFTYRQMDMVGSAELSTDYADDGPTVDIKGEEVTSRIRSVKTKYAYSLQEARAAMLAGVDLDPRKARAARQAVNQKFDDVLLLGDGTPTYLGLRGLYKLTNTTTYTVPNGAAGSQAWSTKTPDEVLKDLHGMANQVFVDTLEVETIDTVGVPTDCYADISTRRIGNETSTTILEQFLKTNPHVKTVFSSAKLNDAGASGEGRAIGYRKDPDVVEAIVPVMFEQLPPQFNGFRVTTHCHARIGGVIAYRPKAVVYADGVKA